MSSKFKVGDKVKVYGNAGSINGTGVYLRGRLGRVANVYSNGTEGQDELTVKIDDPVRGFKHFLADVHPYQCRKLVKKKAPRRVFINVYEGIVDGCIAYNSKEAAVRSIGPAADGVAVEFVEVRKIKVKK